MTINLLGCMGMNKQPSIIPYQLTKTPLDLSLYKNIPISVSDSQVCLSTEDYSKYIQLLNTLKNHIVLQENTLTEIQNYYNHQLTDTKK